MAFAVRAAEFATLYEGLVSEAGVAFSNVVSDPRCPTGARNVLHSLVGPGGRPPYLQVISAASLRAGVPPTSNSPAYEGLVDSVR